MQRRRQAHIVIAALALVLAASCGGGTPGGTGSSGFSAAVDRMTGLRSVRMVGEASGPETTKDVVTMDYQAPDRLHIVQTGSEKHESFQIGSTLHQSEWGRPGYFRPLVLPPNHTTAQAAVFGVMQAMRDRNPVRDGTTYRLLLPDGKGSMIARMEGGYVTEVTVDSAGVRRVQKYSLFNEAPEVIEPPADRILPPLPATPN